MYEIIEHFYECVDYVVDTFGVPALASYMLVVYMLALGMHRPGG
jgi:hypothetical protein